MKLELLIDKLFWKNVDKRGENECWPWIGSGKPGSYGLIIIKSHRFSYELHNGPTPKGSYILHSCDRPGCCNPRHLRTGTHAENMRDIGHAKWSAIRMKQWAAMSEESRKLHSENTSAGLMGKKLSPEHRGKLVAAKLGKPAKISDEAKARKNASIKLSWKLRPRKLTADQVTELRRDLQSGATHMSLAKKYGISRATVGYILHGKLYSSLGTEP